MPTIRRRSVESERASARPLRARIASLVALVNVAACLLLWWFSIEGADFDVRKVTDLGLIVELPLGVLLAPAILTVGFFLTLRRSPLSEAFLFLYVLVLVVMLFGIPIVIDEIPRFNVTWRHSGIVDYISRRGTIDPTIDAYFNWPGFFILSAFFSQTAGLANIVTVADWATMFFHLLYLAPVLMLLRSLTSDGKVVWLGVWLFYLANWIGQDYFSPQALNYFVYLLIVAIVARWFAISQTHRAREMKLLRRSTEAPSPATATMIVADSVSPGQRAGLMAVVLVIFGALVASHQLTPFAVLVAVGALVAVGRCRVPSLPVLMAVVIATWISFMAAAYLAGHIADLTEPLGRFGEIAAANVARRVRGSVEHQVVVRARLLSTAALWGLGMLGASRRFLRGHRDLGTIAMGVAPFILMLLQPYGGEILLRVYLFSLPFFAFFAASFFFRDDAKRPSWRMTVVAALTCLAFLGSFFLTRYGNDRLDEFTRSELGAIDHLYSVARTGSYFFSISDNIPWRSVHYADFRYRPIGYQVDRASSKSVARDVARLVQERRAEGTYLILSRGQQASIDIIGPDVPGGLRRLEKTLRKRYGFHVIYANRDARILAPGPVVEDGER